MKLVYEQTKEATRIVSCVTHNDGSCQIIITGPTGELIGYTDFFPRHEIQDRLHLFLDTELTDRSMEDTHPGFELLDGGKE